MKLGVNIDHIAVLREAREIYDPNPIDALNILRLSGADQVTIHLREDRRHIQDRDVEQIIQLSSLPVNLECSINSEIVDIACNLRPHRVTLVPEKREEVTTEGGLNLLDNFERLQNIIDRFKREEIEVSLFIDPNMANIELSQRLDAEWIELHTGRYANIYAMLYSNLRYTHHNINELDFSRDRLKKMLKKELTNLRILSCDAKELGIKVASGHGLNYQNVVDIVQIDTIEELNIGQSIIARAIWVGLQQAILDMKKILG